MTAAPRRRKGSPYNPAHDRRTQDRLLNAKLAAIEVDDPFELGSKLIVMRSTRNDPLAAMHARHWIDEAQYQGGRAFQHDFEAVERGPRAIDPSKEAVDGGLTPEPITESQRRSARKLGEVHRALGQNGSALVHNVLIHGMEFDEMCKARGAYSEVERKYIGRRFRECLDCLALIYGYAMQT